ncbi:MAG: substrate-binding domain-containing protein, partial [Bacteroidota bacterium]
MKHHFNLIESVVERKNKSIPLTPFEKGERKIGSPPFLKGAGGISVLSTSYFSQTNYHQFYLFPLLILTLIACDPEKGAKYREQQAANQAVEVNSDEEYVMVTTAVNMPLYVNHDQAAFKKWGQQRGVKTSILGPSEWDVQAQIATIEQVVGTRPTGLLINGTDPAIASAIDKAVEAGIPTVVYDSDIP